MALEFQSVPIIFNQGLDTKTDPKQVIPGKLVTLENAIFQTKDLLRKRNGFTNLAAALTAGKGIATFINELVTMDGSSVYSYSAVQATHNSKGTKVAVDLSTTSVVRTSYQQTNADSGYYNGAYCHAWNDSSGGVRYSIIDSSTGQTIVASTQLAANAKNPKVIVLGAFIISYVDTSATTPVLKYIILAGSGSYAPAGSGTFGNMGSSAYYDATLIDGRYFVTWADDSSKTTLAYIDSNYNQSANSQYNVPSGIQCIWGSSINDYVWVAYWNTATFNVSYFVVDFSLPAGFVTAATVIESQPGGISNITGVLPNLTSTVLYEVTPTSGNTYDHFIRTAQVNTGGVVVAASEWLRSVGLAGKAFYQNSTVMALTVFQTTLQPTYFLVSGGKVISKLASGVGGGLITIGLLPEANRISSTVVQIDYLKKDLLTAVAGDVFSQTGVSSALFTFSGAIGTKYLGQNLHLSGGVLSMYDGQSVVEHGFNMFPENLALAYGQSNGALASGSYQYVAVYEWTDSQGQIHRSAPSVAQTLLIDNAGEYSIVGVLTNGSATVSTATSSGQGRPSTAYIGMAITGSGIPAGTYISGVGATSLTMSANYTGTTTPAPGIVLTLTPQILNTASLLCVLTNGSKSITGGPLLSFIVDGVLSGTTFTVRDPAGLSVGMKITNGAGNFAAASKITAISGNVITINNAATHDGAIVSATITQTFTGTATNGSPTMTSVDADVIAGLFVGQAVDSARFGGLSYISSINVAGLTVTLASNAASTGTSASTCYFRPSKVLRVGQVLSNFGSNVGIQAGTKITALADNSSGGSTITVDIATDSGGGSNLVVIFSNVYSARVTVPTLRLTEKTSPAPVSIVLYRTEASGTVFYRVSTVTSPTFNDKTADTVTVYDELSDTVLVGNEQLYTTGGTVENIASPATGILTSYKNRFMLITEEDPLSCWYSKEVIAGSPVEFSDLFQFRINEIDGGITAAAQMDDKFILFTYNTILYMVGDGPSSNGLNNDFILPQLVSTDTGCINKKSLVVTPKGLLYQSTKGIYLLDRSLGVQYIGADVESYNSETITSAQLVEGVNQVRFTLASGSILVFDYFFGQWSVFTNQTAQDSCLFQNLHTYISPAGQVLQESVGTFTDNGTKISIHLRTGWLSFAGLQGFQRVRKLLVLGSYISPHTLTIKAAFDFSTSFDTPTVITNATSVSPYQFRRNLSQQKCETIQIDIAESDTAAFGEGLSLSALAFEVGVKKGLNRVPASRSYA